MCMLLVYSKNVYVEYVYYVKIKDLVARASIRLISQTSRPNSKGAHICMARTGHKYRTHVRDPRDQCMRHRVHACHESTSRGSSTVRTGCRVLDRCGPVPRRGICDSFNSNRRKIPRRVTNAKLVCQKGSHRLATRLGATAVALCLADAEFCSAEATE